MHSEDAPALTNTCVALHGASSRAQGPLREYNGHLYFSADDGSNGNEVWKSDGTAAGTAMLKNINPAGASSSPVRARARVPPHILF